MGKDFYQVLGVDRTATADEIKKAYRKLAHRFHPDKNPGDPVAEDQFKEASRAYQILSDPTQRKRYDRFGSAAFGAGFGFEDFRAGFGGVGDVFSEIFGDFFGRKSQRSSTRGRDRELELVIDFQTAALGGKRTLEVPRTHRCSACSGTGAKPGTSPQICHACGGTGEIRVQQGLLSVSKKCAYCRARGKIINYPCPSCHGEGHQEQTTKLKVRIPPGADDETVLRYPGEGFPGTHPGRAGDLKVVLRVRAHPIFRREGSDIHCEVPVSFVEAALGAQLDVPTLDGMVRMTLPPGTHSGRMFRLRGKGVPELSGTGRGDQHVTVLIEMPKDLTPPQRNWIEQLRRIEGALHYPERTAFWEKVEQTQTNADSEIDT